MPVTHSIRTPLYEFHASRNAKLVEFADYLMPLQYPNGVLKEHRHTRTAAGLFDVCHLGQVLLRPESGTMDQLCRDFENLAPADVLGLPVGRQHYGFFTDDQGGILDDFMFARRPDSIYLVINAARRNFGISHLREKIPGCAETDLKFENRGLLALQGPMSETVLARFCRDIVALRFMDVQDVVIAGHGCIVSRSGYTGEDGFEISVPFDAAMEIAEAIVSQEEVEPIGLGARDTLRLEAGLCLYGSDIDEATTPVEAGLTWAIPEVRRIGGSRAGGFPGAEVINEQIANGVARQRVGILPEGRIPVRAGARIFDIESGKTPIGTVSSGGFSPTLNAPMAMGYVETPYKSPGTQTNVEVRGKLLPARVTALPFVKTGYRK